MVHLISAFAFFGLGFLVFKSQAKVKLTGDILQAVTNDNFSCMRLISTQKFLSEFCQILKIPVQFQGDQRLARKVQKVDVMRFCRLVLESRPTLVRFNASSDSNSRYGTVELVGVRIDQIPEKLDSSLGQNIKISLVKG